MPSQNLLPVCCLAVVLSTIWGTNAQANTKSKKNYIGPSITFGNGQSILGVEGRFNITENIAVRPAYNFMNLAGAGVTVFGGSATYEFNLEESPITPFVGLGMSFYTVNVGTKTGSSSTSFAQAGMDVALDHNITMTSDIKIPFDSNAVLGTVVSVGAGYRF